MAKLKVYNLKGKETDEIAFPKSLETDWNPALVHQAVQAIIANQRKPFAHTKGRGEIRGGGRKPWKQKGTGRARHGSIRSPLWKGGGVTFGPTKEKIYAKKINKKMARKAFLSVLSKKAAEGELKVMESWDLKNHKTKPLAVAIRKIVDEKSVILVSPGGNRNLALASRNLPKVRYLPSSSLNVYNLLSYKDVLMEKKVLEDYAGK